jgi:hypothetical protein
MFSTFHKKNFLKIKQQLIFFFCKYVPIWMLKKPLVSRKWLRIVEYGQIEKYMGNLMIYLISSWGIHHVMCTFKCMYYVYKNIFVH